MKQRIYTIYKMFFSSQGTLYVYSLAYALLLGIAPSIVVLSVFAGKYLYPHAYVEETLLTILPQEMVTPLLNYLDSLTFNNVFTWMWLVVISTFVASQVFYGFMMMTRPLREDQHFTKLFWRIWAFVGFILLLFSIALTTLIVRLFPWLSTLSSLLVLFVSVLVFFMTTQFTADIKKIGGGVLSTTLLLYFILNYFYDLVSRFTHYDATYGPIAWLLSLFLLVHLTSMILYLGHCINATHDSAPRKDVTRLP